jgi:hypothetical protein
LPSGYAGKHVKCAKCKNVLQVPQASQATATTEPVPAGDDLNPFSNLPDFDNVQKPKPAEAPEDEPLRLVANDKPAQQSEFADMISRSPAPSLESTAARGNSMPLKIDSTPIALLASIIFVIIGGMIWGLLAKYTNRQFALAAWGMGVLAGLGIYLFTAHRGTFLGIVAALIAFVGILSGKYFIAKWYYMPQFMAESRFDPNDAKLSKDDLKEIMEEDPEQLHTLVAMQLADDGTITAEDANFYIKRVEEEGETEPNENSQSENEKRFADIQAKIGKSLSEWNRQKTINVIKAQYPKLMKRNAEIIAKNPIAHTIGFVVCFIASFSLFDLIWFPLAMVTAYKFGTGESS